MEARLAIKKKTILTQLFQGIFSRPVVKITATAASHGLTLLSCMCTAEMNATEKISWSLHIHHRGKKKKN